MKCLFPLFLLAFCAICVGADVETCVRLCGELNTIRQAEVDAKAQWEEHRLALEGELAAAKAQLADVLISLSALEKETAGKRASLEAIEKETAQLKARLEGVIPQLRAAEKAFLKQYISFPQPLAEKLAPIWQKLKDPCDSLEDVPDRLAALLSAHAVICDFAGKVTLATAYPPAEKGNRREYDVLYLGLASAYALPKDGSEAAYGQPIGRGWTFDATLTKPISRALDVASGRASAELVPLPMKISLEEDK